MSEESQEFDSYLRNSNKRILLDEDLSFCQECKRLKDYCNCHKGVD